MDVERNLPKEYILYVQKKIPSNVPEGTDQYDTWAESVNQSIQVIEGSFNLQPYIECVEFSTMSAEERPDYIIGVPMMVKIGTSELFTGVEEILEEFARSCEESNISNIEFVDTKGDFNDSSINDPSWCEPVQDNDDDNSYLENEDYGFTLSDSIQILNGDAKVKESDVSFAKKRLEFIEQRRRSRISTHSSDSNSATEQQQTHSNPVEMKNRSTRPLLSQSNASVRDEYMHKTINKDRTPSLMTPRHLPQQKQSSLQSKYDVPLAQHPLFKTPITLDKWNSFTKEEQEEVHRIVNRLRSENYPIPKLLSQILDNDIQISQRQYRVMMDKSYDSLSLKKHNQVDAPLDHVEYRQYAHSDVHINDADDEDMMDIDTSTFHNNTDVEFVDDAYSTTNNAARTTVSRPFANVRLPTTQGINRKSTIHLSQSN